MFEWMNRHKKDIMKYTLYLVIPSFIMLYGYGECAAPQRYAWVAKVNGQEITENEWRSTADNLRRQMQNQGAEELPYEEMQNQALQYAIVNTLYRQKAEEWGIGTTDAEIARAISEVPYFQNDGQFDYNLYRSVLYSNQLSEYYFEAQQRETLTRSKVQAVVSESLFRAEPEKKRNQQLLNQTVQVEYIAFEPANYVEEVSVTDEGLIQYFQDSQEDFRIPEQRRIAFARFYPSRHAGDVTFTTREITRYFEQNRQQYELPESIRLQYITYTPQNFTEHAQVSEEEIQNHYVANSQQYMNPAQTHVLYIQQPLDIIALQQQITDEQIEQYFQENERQFEHPEQAKARHILLKTPTGGSPEDAQAVRDKIMQIREEIAQGLPFAEAARQYSEDTSASRGGDLGYFGRGRMVPEFEQTAFDLPLGQVSEPVKTDYGYHLILVEDRREAGKETLQQAAPQIRELMQKRQAIEQFRELARNVNSLEELRGQYNVNTTDWFSRNTQELPGIPERETSYFVSTAFNTDPGRVAMAGNTNTEFLYLIQPQERQVERIMSQEEARPEVLKDLQEEKAAQIAMQVAQADAAQIKSASLELQMIAEQRGLEIKTTSSFTRDDPYIQGFGPRSLTLNQAAFALEQGEVGGPVLTPQGAYIFRVVAREPARLPELEDVRTQVEQDFIKQAAERLARAEANSFSLRVFQNRGQLTQMAAQEGIESGTSDFFKQNEPIPGLGPLRSVSQQAFELKEEGQVSDAIEERLPTGFNAPNQSQQPIDAYYVVQLTDIRKSYLPDLEEVRSNAEYAYKLKLAEPIALEKAQQALQTIQSLIAGSEPVSASRAVDLKEIAADFDEAVYREPVQIDGMGSVPSLGRALVFTKTALALNPGQVSGVVTNYRTRFTEDNKREQGSMTGAYILQVLEKREAPADEQSPMNQIEQYFDQALQNMAVSAWIDEVSAEAKIEYNRDILSYGDTVETQMTSDENIPDEAAADDPAS